MKTWSHRGLSALLSVSLVTPHLVFAAAPNPPPGPVLTPTASAADSVNEFDLARANGTILYWLSLRQEQPALYQFFMETTDGLEQQRHHGDPAVLDADPFFTHSSSWEPIRKACPGDVCTERDGGHVLIQDERAGKVFRLNQPFNVAYVTETHVFLKPESDAFLGKKISGEGNASEGYFFIARSDLVAMAAIEAPVPVFFLPMPETGWDQPIEHAVGTPFGDQLIFSKADGSTLPIRDADLAELEYLERENFRLTTLRAFEMEGAPPAGIVHPRPNSTASFGLFLAGSDQQVKRRESPLEAAPALASTPSIWGKPKDWILPGALGGLRLGSAAYLAGTVDWHSLIPVNMGSRVEFVAGLMGSVAVISVIRRMWQDRELFAKKYPRAEYPGVMGAVNREHKAFLDEFSHASYFAATVIPLGMRHALDFAKDRIFSANKVVHKGWEWCMGFEMKTNDKLAMNWRTWWLGVPVFGMIDAVSVMIDMLVIAPAIMHAFGLSWGGSAAAAFAGSEVLRNFLAYLQQGAHIYSHDVKMMGQSIAESTAKRQIANEGLDPRDERNAARIAEITKEITAKAYEEVALPGENEFMYDPNSALQGLTKRLGFGFDSIKIADSDAAEFKTHAFALKTRYWGKVKPALKLARKAARATNDRAPSELGAQVIRFLDHTEDKRGFVRQTLARAKNVIFGGAAGRDEFKDSVRASEDAYVKAAGASASAVGRFNARAKGAIGYFGSESAKAVRDQRMALFLMSTNRDPEMLKRYLPKSWVDGAGSVKAAELAAVLFNRSFNALLNSDKSRADANADDLAKYGEKAEGVIREQTATAPINDAFEREVLKSEIALAEREKAMKQKEITEFKPKDEGYVAQKQWAVARAVAERTLAESPIAEGVAAAWAPIYQSHVAKAGDAALDERSFVELNRYRLEVAREYARNVGLQTRELEDSPLMRAVVAEATKATEAQLALPGERAYAAKLNEADRRFYEAKIFNVNFVGSYVLNSARSRKYVPNGGSGEIPGVLQAWRTKTETRTDLVGVVQNRAARVFETFFRSEPGSYRPGLLGKLERNVPMLPDMLYAVERTARRLPFLLTLTYLTYFYVWQVQSPWDLWALSGLLAFWHPAFVEMNTRFMRSMDKKAMESIPNKITYAITHGIATNPKPMFVESVSEGVHLGYVAATAPVAAGLESCAAALGF